MKLTAVLLVACSLQVSARAISQTVTFSAKDVAIEKVFSEIKRQTGYLVFCSYDILLETKPVTIDAKNMPVVQFMGKLCSDLPLDFSIENKTILISKKQQAAPTLAPVFLPPPPVVIRGKVSDESGAPVEGATVAIKGSTGGVSTDANGEFALSSDNKDIVLVVSHVNFATREVTTKIVLILFVRFTASPEQDIPKTDNYYGGRSVGPVGAR